MEPWQIYLLGRWDAFSVTVTICWVVSLASVWVYAHEIGGLNFRHRFFPPTLGILIISTILTILMPSKKDLEAIWSAEDPCKPALYTAVGVD
jgi:hypothetical protein